MSRGLHFQPPRKKRDRLMIQNKRKYPKLEGDRAYPVAHEPKKQEEPSPASESMENFSYVHQAKY